MGAPLLSISPEMETFVLAYPEGTLADPSVGIYISKVNSTSRTVERYSVPPIFYTLQSPTIALFEDYIYAS